MFKIVNTYNCSIIYSFGKLLSTLTENLDKNLKQKTLNREVVRIKISG